MLTQPSMCYFAPISARTGQELNLPMQELHLSGVVTPAGAMLTVQHVFQNAEDRSLEVVYAFGLPRDATLRRFRIKAKRFEAHSELKPTQEAVRIYERALEKGYLSTLARVYRDGVVNLSVGNLRPGERVIVWLEIIAGVDLYDRSFRFRFPFTLAPRYHRMAVPEQVAPGEGMITLPRSKFGDVLLPRWKRDVLELHGIGFKLKIEAGCKIARVSSPSHTIECNFDGDNEVTVWLAQDKDVPNRDLVLDVETVEPIHAIIGGPTGDDRADFVAVIPSTQFGRPRKSAREVVL